MIVSLENLNELYLSFNKINAEGGALIFQACRLGTSLKVLDLQNNYLG